MHNLSLLHGFLQLLVLSISLYVMKQPNLFYTRVHNKNYQLQYSTIELLTICVVIYAYLVQTAAAELYKQVDVRQLQAVCVNALCIVIFT